SGAPATSSEYRVAVVTSFALQISATELARRTALHRFESASAIATKGTASRYEAAILHTCNAPRGALHRGPPQKRKTSTDTTKTAVRGAAPRPEPRTPVAAALASRLVRGDAASFRTVKNPRTVLSDSLSSRDAIRWASSGRGDTHCWVIGF